MFLPDWRMLPGKAIVLMALQRLNASLHVVGKCRGLSNIFAFKWKWKNHRLILHKVVAFTCSAVCVNSENFFIFSSEILQSVPVVSVTFLYVPWLHFTTPPVNVSFMPLEGSFPSGLLGAKLCCENSPSAGWMDEPGGAEGRTVWCSWQGSSAGHSCSAWPLLESSGGGNSKTWRRNTDKRAPLWAGRGGQ